MQIFLRNQNLFCRRDIHISKVPSKHTQKFLWVRYKKFGESPRHWHPFLFSFAKGFPQDLKISFGLLAIIDWNTWNARAAGPSTTQLHACMQVSVWVCSSGCFMDHHHHLVSYSPSLFVFLAIYHQIFKKNKNWTGDFGGFQLPKLGKKK